MTKSFLFQQVKIELSTLQFQISGLLLLKLLTGPTSFYKWDSDGQSFNEPPSNAQDRGRTVFPWRVRLPGLLTNSCIKQKLWSAFPGLFSALRLCCHCISGLLGLPHRMGAHFLSSVLLVRKNRTNATDLERPMNKRLSNCWVSSYYGDYEDREQIDFCEFLLRVAQICSEHIHGWNDWGRKWDPVRHSGIRRAS